MEYEYGIEDTENHKVNRLRKGSNEIKWVPVGPDSRVSALAHSNHFENSVPDSIWKPHDNDSGTGAGTDTYKNRNEIKQHLI